MTDSQHGRLIVLCGPAGVGKGTVLGRVREQHPEVWLSVSATTRQPRPGEVDGVNYFFMPEQEFLDKEAAGEFLETADVFGLAHYGTPVKPVVEHLERNIPVILEIDIQGARSVKQRAGELGIEVMTVFIAPPSFEELERRLIGRGTEIPEQQAKRLETAKSSLPRNRNSTKSSSIMLWMRQQMNCGTLSQRNSICNHNNYKDCNMRSNISGAYFI